MYKVQKIFIVLVLNTRRVAIKIFYKSSWGEREHAREARSTAPSPRPRSRARRRGRMGGMLSWFVWALGWSCSDREGGAGGGKLR